MTDEIKAYQDLVNSMAEKNSTELLPNAGEIHAAIVMSKLFDKTDHTVNMALGSFSGKVSNQDNYLQSLENCINKHVKFRILFLDNPNEESAAYNLLMSKKAQNYPIEFSLASPETRARFQKKDKPFHFAVFDSDKYRLEVDTSQHIAWVCFNSPENAAKLNAMFDQVFQ